MSVKESHYWSVRARCTTFVFDHAKAFPRLSPWQCCKNSAVLMSNATPAVTRIRTKVAAATTQSTNHYTITESHEDKHLPLGCTYALFTGTSIPIIHRNRPFGSRPYLEMPSQLIALFSPPLSNILPLANKPKGTKIVSLRAIFQTWWFLSWLLTLVESLLSLPLLIHARFLLSFTKRGPQTSSYETERVVASKWILLVPIFGQTGQNLWVLGV